MSRTSYTQWLPAILFAVMLFLCAPTSRAQEGLSVTVTPPLFQLTIGPGEKWSSTIKVVNSNANEVAYYTQVMNFEASGEGGGGKFAPVVNESPEDRLMSLANWIQIPRDPILIPAGQSREVPFTVDIPADASPGGHYAAILIGTQPPSESAEGSIVKVSSYVSSLLFVRIKGDVYESGRIREFSADKSLYQTPEAKFSVRFENTGNTHLQPQGDITIFNMWGKERGKLLINQKDNFGNVLPKSIRKFEFSWKGEESAFDIGRYSAVVTLGFGSEGKQNTSAITYFWVIPIVPVAITVGILFFFIFLVTWFIRRYIRRALEISLARAPVTNIPHAPATPVRPELVERAQPAPARPIATLMEPIREGVIDLRSMRQAKVQTSTSQAQSSTIPAASLTTGQFISKYRLFFVFILVLMIGCAVAWWYFTKALKPERSFQITDVTIKEEPSTP